MASEWADYVRLLIFIIYGLTIGHIAWIVRLYAGFTDRLLPRHVLVVGVMFIACLTEVVYQNAVRVGEPFSPYVVVNLLLTAGSLYSMVNMRQHIAVRRRKAWTQAHPANPPLDELRGH